LRIVRAGMADFTCNAVFLGNTARLIKSLI
jgi:hypothetical protein